MDLELGVAQFGKKLLPPCLQGFTPPPKNFIHLERQPLSGLPFQMYRGLEGVQGELLLKKFPLHVLA